MCRPAAWSIPIVRRTAYDYAKPLNQVVVLLEECRTPVQANDQDKSDTVVERMISHPCSPEHRDRIQPIGAVMSGANRSQDSDGQLRPKQGNPRPTDEVKSDRNSPHDQP